MTEAWELQAQRCPFLRFLGPHCELGHPQDVLSFLFVCNKQHQRRPNLFSQNQRRTTCGFLRLHVSALQVIRLETKSGSVRPSSEGRKVRQKRSRNKGQVVRPMQGSDLLSALLLCSWSKEATIGTARDHVPPHTLHMDCEGSRDLGKSKERAVANLSSK